MRFLVGLFLLLSISIYAQNQTEVYPKKLSDNEAFVLNSGLKSTVKGSSSSKTVKKFSIPENTQWILINVVVDAENAKSNKEKLTDVAKQVGSVKWIPVEARLVSMVGIMVSTPNVNNMICDVLQFNDTLNSNKFLMGEGMFEKRSGFQTGPAEYQYRNTNHFQQSIPITKLKDKKTLILGFRNNNNTTSVKVSLDVIALVSTGWTVPRKNQFIDYVKSNCSTHGITNKEMVENVSMTIASEYFSGMTYSDYKAQSPKVVSYEVNLRIKRLSAAFLPGDSTVKAISFIQLAKSALESEKFDQAKKYSAQAMALSPKSAEVNFGRGLILLACGDSSAMDFYVDGKALLSRSINPKKALEDALKDLEDYADWFSDADEPKAVKELLKL